MARLSFRCDDELIARVDLVRGDVARERWLRRVVEASVAELGLVELPVVDRQAAGSSPVATGEQSGGMPVVAEGLVGSPVEFFGVAPRGLPGACPFHPDARRVESRGQWWCGEPGCTRVVGAP